MKLCKNCEYFTETNFCKSPNNGKSPINGKPKVIFATVSRNDNELCGIDGKHYVEKTIVLPWWKRLFK